MKSNNEQPSSNKEFNAMLDTIYVVGGKWKMHIIHSICAHKNHRFMEIERSIPGSTSRMLARELKEMEANKLITRTVYDEMPVRIEYDVTEYCNSLVPVVQSLVDWGMLHRQKIMED